MKTALVGPHALKAKLEKNVRSSIRDMNEATSMRLIQQQIKDKLGSRPINTAKSVQEQVTQFRITKKPSQVFKEKMALLKKKPPSGRVKFITEVEVPDTVEDSSDSSNLSNYSFSELTEAEIRELK